MFCLLIHVEPQFLISFNKSCRLCPACELLIVKQADLEHYLATILEGRAPEMIGNDYMVMGTIDRRLHRQGKAGTLDTKTTIDGLTPFRRELEFTLGGGWGPG